MRVNISRQALTDALAYVVKGCGRPSLPVLSGIVLTVTESRPDTLTVHTFDFEILRSVDVPGVSLAPGTFCAPGKLLAAWVAKLPRTVTDVALSVSGSTLSVAAGTASVTYGNLVTDVPAPAVPQLPPVIGDVDVATLSGMAVSAGLGAGTDLTLPMLTCVRVRTDGAHIDMTTTDRYRAHSVAGTWSPAAGTASSEYLVPSVPLVDMVKRAAKRAGKAAATATVRAGMTPVDGRVPVPVYAVTVDGYTLATRTYEGQFAPVDKLFPEQFAASVTFNARAMVDMVKRGTSGYASDGKTPVILTFGDGTVTAEIGRNEDGTGPASSETLAGADTDHADQVDHIGFNPAYLIDSIAAFGKVDQVTLRLVNSVKPAVFTADGTAVRVLLMPIRTDRVTEDAARPAATSSKSADVAVHAYVAKIGTRRCATCDAGKTAKIHKVATVAADSATVDQVDTDVTEDAAPVDVVNCADPAGHMPGVAGCPVYLRKCSGVPTEALEIVSRPFNTSDAAGAVTGCDEIGTALTSAYGRHHTVTGGTLGDSDRYGHGNVRPVTSWSHLVDGHTVVLVKYDGRTPLTGVQSYGALFVDGAPVDGSQDLTMARTPQEMANTVAWRVRRHLEDVADASGTAAPADVDQVDTSGGTDDAPADGDTVAPVPAADSNVDGTEPGTDQVDQVAPVPDGTGSGDRVRDILARATWSGGRIKPRGARQSVSVDVLTLPAGSLPRDVYADVADVARALGGGWNRDAKGFVFEPSRLVWNGTAQGVHTESGAEKLAAWLVRNAASADVDQVDAPEESADVVDTDQVAPGGVLAASDVDTDQVDTSGTDDAPADVDQVDQVAPVLAADVPAGPDVIAAAGRAALAAAVHPYRYRYGVAGVRYADDVAAAALIARYAQTLGHVSVPTALAADGVTWCGLVGALPSGHTGAPADALADVSSVTCPGCAHLVTCVGCSTCELITTTGAALVGALATVTDTPRPADFDAYRADIRGCTCGCCLPMSYATNYAGRDRDQVASGRVLLAALMAGVHTHRTQDEHIAAAKVDHAVRVAAAVERGASADELATIDRGYTTVKMSDFYATGMGLGMTRGGVGGTERARRDESADQVASVPAADSHADVSALAAGGVDQVDTVPAATGALATGPVRLVYADTPPTVDQARALATTPVGLVDSPHAHPQNVMVSGRGPVNGYRFHLVAGARTRAVGKAVRSALGNARGTVGGSLTVTSPAGSRTINVVPASGHTVQDWSAVLATVAGVIGDALATPDGCGCDRAHALAESDS